MQIIPDKTIGKRAVVNAPVADVWHCWTTSEGVKSFIAPDAHIELHIGGAYEWYFIMDAPMGGRGSETCTVLSFVPNTMLSFTWNAPPHFPEVRNHRHKSWVTVLFSALDNGTTQVDLYHHGWLPGEDWDAVYTYFEEAWQVVLDRLVTHFAP